MPLFSSQYPLVYESRDCYPGPARGWCEEGRPLAFCTWFFLGPVLSPATNLAAFSSFQLFSVLRKYFIAINGAFLYLWAKVN